MRQGGGCFKEIFPHKFHKLTQIKMKPDIEDKRNVPRGSRKCREGHLNPDKDSTCKECEDWRYKFPREQYVKDIPKPDVPKVDLGNEGAVPRGRNERRRVSA